MHTLLAEDPSWDLDKEGAHLPFTELVAREMGKKIFRYHDIFGAREYYEHPLFTNLKGHILKRYHLIGGSAGHSGAVVQHAA